MEEVVVRPVDLKLLAAAIPPRRAEELMADAGRAREAFGDRVIWHVNATAHGGGVAEMLQTLLGYAAGAGVENRWVVLDGDPLFFAITKRLHNMLHGEAGDGGALGPAERAHYDDVVRRNLESLLPQVSPDDVVVLHDPQAAGLAAGMRGAVAGVLWRCHVGRDEPNELTVTAWEFLRPYLAHADALVFSRQAYAPNWLEQSRVVVIPPSIDPLALKNVPLAPDQVRSILTQVGLLAGRATDQTVAFTRSDGSAGEVRPHGSSGGLVLDGDPPPADAPLVVQVSRWDRLKDMGGVLTGFVGALDAGGLDGAHLMLLGPDVTGVADDPEGAEVLAECQATWEGLPPDVRSRVHLAVIPMDDADENAIIVNAVQRHAAVVVQKSLVEGFGLTVTEAMWKGRPVIASRVGGIQDQITDGEDGLLLQDARDLDEFAEVLAKLLSDPDLASRLGTAAHARVLDAYVTDRHLRQYVDLLSSLPRIGSDLR